MDGEGRRERVRSFLIGGLLGASAAVAAGRRRRRHRAARTTPPGLAAFEDAPCYRELLAEDETATATGRRGERGHGEPS